MTDTTQLPVTTEENRAREAREQAQAAEPKVLDALHTEHGGSCSDRLPVRPTAGPALSAPSPAPPSVLQRDR